ncbi:ATP-binding cassette, subfamily C (CFTR/MRP), member 1 [Entomortierella parvispora]|uniref:ATP-binding cassette, subfamily C (CFTR/MRP), member 1 n=1 Tax=Entomortierella parvispora TaxID=205924 RepID=A0A9P3LWC8_9FUNG|nr:ATP-binding cassette, subfamily C (CFTR/MRP), member 1 [Entomortierella parvispora]
MSTSYCRDSEGWGPTSDHRTDLTLCFESTILSTLPALLAILAFIHRMYTLLRTRQAHGLGRTNLIYWPCQFFMAAAAIVLLVRAGLIGQEANHSPASVLASASVAMAWLTAVLLNYFEHKYEIRSSTPIFSFYFVSVVVSAITIRTISELPDSTGTDAVLYYTYFALIIFGFTAESWPRGSTKVQQQSSASPYEKANLFSRYWFFYLQHIISAGYKKPLQGSDVADMMPQRIKTQFSYSLLANQWDQHVLKRRNQGKEPRLILLVLKAYGVQWIPILVYRVLASILSFVAPVLMNQLLSFTGSYSTDAPMPVVLGIILSFGMFFSTIASALLEGQFNQLIMNMGIEARTALISMIYRKALRLSPAARNEQSPGDIQNHMSVDAERWSEALPLLPMWLSIPFEICIALWLLYQQLGWAAIAGAGTVVVVSPVQAWIASFFARAKDEKLAAMDNRIRLLNEVFSGIKIVKLYGWESSFRAKVAVFRNRELAILRKIGVAFSFMTIMFSSLTLLMALVSFSIFASVSDGVINSQTIFVSITLFGLLNRPIGMLSFTTGETMGLIVATRRIQKYLLAEELSEGSIEHIDELPNDLSLPVIEVKDGVFAWDKEGPEVETEKQIKAREKKEAKKAKQEAKEALEAGLPAPTPGTPIERNYEPTLKDINLSVHCGYLTAVVGRVGQGKTSLFNAMIGDMYKRRGTVKINGRIAYAPQQPWIINATLKDNVVFGCTFDQERYDRIVFAAGLTPDFEMLPAADLTEIGERGINLSGGQKQRVSLARAAYQDADIYLLDDPLSAVDAHVDQHLWKHLIGPEGLLNSKTRLLVTHGIHHLHEADQIVVIKDGVITETGQYQELMDAKNAFYQLIEDYSVKQRQRDTDSESMNDAETVKEMDETTEIAHAHALHDKAMETQVEKQDENAELVEEEEMKVGSIHWHVYKVYAKAASYRNAIQVLILFVVIQSCQIGTNTWLQNWVEVVNDTTHSVGYYMGIYAVLVVGFMLLTVWTSYTTMVSAGVRASERLHNDLLNNVLRLPMSFFDTTPVGRVINRFSSDCFSIDEQIPWAFHDMFFCFVSVMGSLIVIVVTTPIFLVIVPPVFLVYVFVQSYYIASSRAFKRIESISKSPMYQHFSETLSGVSTIRAMRCNERFIVENATKSDLASNAHFVWAVGNRWLNARLEALGSIIVLAASLFSVFSRNSLNASMVGLSLSYALNITQDITWMVRCFCELQNELVGVERVKEYSEKNQEAPNETDVVLPESWPSQGNIVFKNYSTRYRQGMDLVIKNVSFEVLPGEKVGIVGRTGAGKSSLTLALFRVIEAANSHWAKASHNGSDYDSDPSKVDVLPAELEKVEVEEDGGSIEIDGVDISTIGLEHLRQHLAIIPQDPTLFVGTVRDNLDPFEQSQDLEIWEALERAHLKEYISSMPAGLSCEVTQNGENFSVGQRSLICLARALLRKTKILILDEATAAVDVETDELIQKTIRKEFKDRTILTIAHRIKTVMDSDKILVLEKGRVEEFESPVLLMQRKESLFYKLAEQAGEVASA